MPHTLQVQDTIDLQTDLQQRNPLEIEILAAPQNCGVLLLINKLLKNRSEKPASRENASRMVKLMLSNIHDSKVIVFPTTNDQPLQFVKQLLQEAVDIINSPTDYSEGLYPSAKHLMNALTFYRSGPNDSSRLALINSWKNFATHFFQDKITN